MAALDSISLRLTAPNAELLVWRPAMPDSHFFVHSSAGFGASGLIATLPATSNLNPNFELFATTQQRTPNLLPNHIEGGYRGRP